MTHGCARAARARGQLTRFPSMFPVRQRFSRLTRVLFCCPGETAVRSLGAWYQASTVNVSARPRASSPLARSSLRRTASGLGGGMRRATASPPGNAIAGLTCAAFRLDGVGALGPVCAPSLACCVASRSSGRPAAAFRMTKFSRTPSWCGARDATSETVRGRKDAASPLRAHPGGWVRGGFCTPPE
jgi:hypothetical protein